MASHWGLAALDPSHPRFITSIRLNPIPEILDDLRHGKMIVLVDDEHRENEGDLVCAAQFADAKTINFMLREARGMLCVALAGEICDRLELGPQSAVNTAPLGTAYTITVDAHRRFGIATGVSAADRATTIGVLVDGASVPSDLARPGHVNPLRARDGGVLVRAGQTEGSVDLCRLAGLEPGGVIIEVMNDDGSMARQGDLEKLCARHELKMCSVADVIQYRLERQKLIERIAETDIETETGPFRLIAYDSFVDPYPHVALVCGDLGRADEGLTVETTEPVLVRMHRQNLLGDVFNCVDRPTGRTLATAMRRIQEEGCGALVYLRHENPETDLLQRLQTPRLPDDRGRRVARPGLSEGLGGAGRKSPVDMGAYGIGAQILRDLGILKLRLLTDHPFRPAALSGFGLEICEFLPMAGEGGVRGDEQ
ncbi:MAG: 3,4-dihydroxy-2-butanone-4-phosphate synthase [Phycisphaeraceae bacterium]|nr:3,4-dihydroxy-2-butanone-4-phosphate synthase [Phycisphaeraceae bacterium]